MTEVTEAVVDDFRGPSVAASESDRSRDDSDYDEQRNRSEKAPDNGVNARVTRNESFFRAGRREQKPQIPNLKSDNRIRAAFDVDAVNEAYVF